MRRIVSLLGVCAVVFVNQAALGARIRDLPVTLAQPDGSRIDCFLSGDEFFRWAHDAAGFVLTRDAAGVLVYARTLEGEIEPTSWPAGSLDDPTMAALQPGPPAPAALDLGRRRIHAETLSKRPAPRMPNTGQLNNIVVFLRFSDQTEFPDAVSTWDALFNAEESGANSMSRYYQEVSKQQLDIRTSLFPASTGTVVSFLDSHPRGYYQQRSAGNLIGYTSEQEGGERLHDLLRRAVEAIAEQVPPALDVDVNDDGYVDNVCYIARGTADSWADWLWPHMWNLQFGNVAFINGKQVSTYNFQLADVVHQPHVGNGVLCHEMFHSLGAPDLYRYETGSGTYFPVGKWDLMEDNENPPQHMLSFMKLRYGGWIASIPRITASGVYTLNPVTEASGTCYRIDSPNTTSEYFLVEYRRTSSSMFETGLPGSGLIVYRINTAADGNGNADGPPDEVYVYRPNGSLSVNGDPSAAHFSSGAGRTAINDQTNPSSFLSTNQPGGLNLSEVGGAGGTISFRVTIAGSPPPPACATTMGDSNGDAAVNVFDLIAVVNDILAVTPLGEGGRACADLAQPTGSVDIFDLIGIVNLILQGGPEPFSTARSEEEVEPDPVRVLLSCDAGGDARLSFEEADAARVAGIQCAWPGGSGTGAPVLLEAEATTSFSWFESEGVVGGAAGVGGAGGPPALPGVPPGGGRGAPRAAPGRRTAGEWSLHAPLPVRGGGHVVGCRCRLADRPGTFRPPRTGAAGDPGGGPLRPGSDPRAGSHPRYSAESRAGRDADRPGGATRGAGRGPDPRCRRSTPLRASGPGRFDSAPRGDLGRAGCVGSRGRLRGLLRAHCGRRRRRAWSGGADPGHPVEPRLGAMRPPGSVRSVA